MNKLSKQDLDILGIIPAAGTASRFSPLPCSKEILPIGIEKWGDRPYERPKVAIHYLLENMMLAGIKKTYITIRNNKWDIPAYLGDGKNFGIDIAYLIMGLPYGAPFSINQAYPFIESSIVALGYPDILFRPKTAYKPVIEKLNEGNADVVLGLFPATNSQKMDMIEFDKNNKITRFVIKPKVTNLKYTYINAVWTPAFSNYLNDYLETKFHDLELDNKTEFYVGDIFQAYHNDGNRIGYTIFEDGSYIDIGTVEDYAGAILKYSKV